MVRYGVCKISIIVIGNNSSYISPEGGRPMRFNVLIDIDHTSYSSVEHRHRPHSTGQEEKNLADEKLADWACRCSGGPVWAI